MSTDLTNRAQNLSLRIRNAFWLNILKKQKDIDAMRLLLAKSIQMKMSYSRSDDFRIYWTTLHILHR